MPEGIELPEVHHDHEDSPLVLPVSITISIMAVLVAGVTLMGHRAHTEELMRQNQATDEWSYYQAVNIRRHNYEMGIDLLALVDFKDKAQAEKVHETYQKNAERYQKEQAEIQDKAKEFEAESAHGQREADRFDLGEVFLEVALVISSLALLSGKRIFWFLGIVAGLAGLGVALTGFLLH